MIRPSEKCFFTPNLLRRGLDSKSQCYPEMGASHALLAGHGLAPIRGDLIHGAFDPAQQSAQRWPTAIDCPQHRALPWRA